MNGWLWFVLWVALVVLMAWRFLEIRRRPFLIVVRYRSGHKVRFRAAEFEFHDQAIGRSARWTGAKPQVLLIGLDDIETVIGRRAWW